jgi:hypothetical protein
LGRFGELFTLSFFLGSTSSLSGSKSLDRLLVASLQLYDATAFMQLVRVARLLHYSLGAGFPHFVFFSFAFFRLFDVRFVRISFPDFRNGERPLLHDFETWSKWVANTEGVVISSSS